ncbi:hypothetical protein APHAL10511_004849 [Amanita phalloides]|nr:hypothetical protein APHAL10511_004849 [Amanita phalloides]
MVQISERSVGPDDVVVTIFPRSELWRLPASGYHRVPERTWAKLDKNSPVSGLCTDMADTSLVLVCHCNSTGRTTMMHTPTVVDMQAIVDQLDYVTDNSSVPVEMVVLRGGIYSDRRKHELVGDAQRYIEEDMLWVDQFLHDMRVHAKKMSLPLTITRPDRCLEQGCMSVDKKTGRITIPVPTDDFAPYKYPYIGLPDSTSEFQFLQVRTRDKFYSIIATAHAISMQQFGLRFAYPSFLQYDGNSSTPLPRMPDFARTVLQQYALYGPLPPDLVIPISDKLNATVSEELRGYVNQYPLREQGMFCEVCRKQTKSTCNSCRTAWYCSRSHQTLDWKDHRVWCKAHRVSGSSSSSTPQRRDSGSFSALAHERRDTGESQILTRPSEKVVSKHEASEAQKVIAEPTEEGPSQKPNETVPSHIVTEKVQVNVIEPVTAPASAEEKQDNAVIVKEEPIATVPAETSLQITPTLKTSRPLVRYLRVGFGLGRTSDAGAVFHRYLKNLGRSLYSWKFYLCIVSVLFAYIIRFYHLDFNLIYPLA